MSYVRETSASNKFDPASVTRPDGKLLRYYTFISLLSGPLFPFVFVPLYCKFITLRYEFDQSGISMRWGVLFRREVNLTYRRIQDIHLTRNLLQRWMGLASLGVQTAAGSSAAELTIEGVLAFESLRDYLYAEMRGARGLDGAESDDAEQASASAGGGDEALAVLTDIRDSLRAVGQRLDRLEQASDAGERS